MEHTRVSEATASDRLDDEEAVPEPLVDEHQATLNIGIIGHVAHGKSSLVRALTGVKTQKHKQELERNITIHLGYANCKIYRCTQEECPAEMRYLSRPSSCKAVTLQDSGRPYRLVRHVSFVDCPGHEALMKNMLSGAAVMDAALLLVAANEPCPAPQTTEHLSASECLGLRDVLTVQNKVDLVSAAEAEEHCETVRAFVDGTAAAARGVTPVCAQLGFNLHAVLEQIANLPERPRNLEAPARMYLIRSFDINRPGTETGGLGGGVAGGAVVQGTLRKGQEVEIRPGICRRDFKGRPQCTPLRTYVESLHSEQTSLDHAIPGGLIGVGTSLDPSLTKEDRLKGQVLGTVGTLPPILSELTIRPSLMKRIAGSQPADGGSRGPDLSESPLDTAKDDKIKKLKAEEQVLVSVGAASVVGRVLSSQAKQTSSVRIALETPVCTAIGDVVALSREVTKDKYRLIGRGDILDGKELEPMPPLLDHDVIDVHEPRDEPKPKVVASPPFAATLKPATTLAAMAALSEPSVDVSDASMGVVSLQSPGREPRIFAFDSEGEDRVGTKAAYRKPCRMLEKVLPEVDDAVMVQITRAVEGEGVYCSLLEYGGHQAFIPSSEYTRARKARSHVSLAKEARAGKQEVCTVRCVDEGKGYVDLSRKDVTPEERAECEQRYRQAKLVHSMVRHVAVRNRIGMEALYELTAWPLECAFECRAHDAFSIARTRPDEIFNDEYTPGLAPQLRTALLEEIARRLAPTSTKVLAHIKVRCFGQAGVHAVRYALVGGLASVGVLPPSYDVDDDDEPSSEAESSVHIKLVAPPLYTLSYTCSDSQEGIAMLKRVIEAIDEKIRQHPGGELAVTEAPHAADETQEDMGVATLIARLDQAGRKTQLERDE